MQLDSQLRCGARVDVLVAVNFMIRRRRSGCHFVDDGDKDKVGTRKVLLFGNPSRKSITPSLRK